MNVHDPLTAERGKQIRTVPISGTIRGQDRILHNIGIAVANMFTTGARLVLQLRGPGNRHAVAEM